MSAVTSTPDSLCIGLPSTAALMGVSYDWLQRNWRTLCAEQGFPWPYLGSRKGERPRWFRAWIVDWMARRAEAPEPPPSFAQIRQVEPVETPAMPPANDKFPEPGDPVAQLLKGLA